MTETAQTIPADPMPNGPLGMYFFLASEAMFFVGMLGSFLVLQAGQRELFHHMASMLSTWETSVLILLLVASSMTLGLNKIPRDTGLRSPNEHLPHGPMARFTTARSKQSWIVIALAVAFTVFQLLIMRHLLRQRTIVARVNDKAVVYAGSTLDKSTSTLVGVCNDLPENFDAAKVTPADLAAIRYRRSPTSAATMDSKLRTFEIPPSAILQDVSYGPSRNNFFGCYFLIVGTHLVHLLVGIAAMLWLSLRTVRGTATATNISCVYTYWHFVNIVGILGLLLLFFA